MSAKKKSHPILTALRQATQETRDECLMPPPPNVLYHYTTLQSFISILDSQSLWATDIRVLNDRSELDYGLKEAIKIYVEMLGSHDVHKSNDKTMFDTVVDILVNRRDEITSHFYVTSFSAEKNQLEQWRAYCRDGGVCFGLRAADVYARQGSHFDIIKCIYDEKLMKKELRILIGKIVHKICKIESGENMNDCEEMTPNNCAYVIARVLCSAALCYKKTEFAHEQEYRLVALPPASRNGIRATRLRMGENMAKPYFANPIAINDEHAVKMTHVTISPTLSRDTVQSIKRLKPEFLDKNCRVVQSRLPLR
ncbi:MAG: DUF2971 domain-containing protein [Planctomycetota bacterium]|nr:DUF2971 domain-containing protein [Planctomycetota bacterium]